jgi:hypothetical protein
MSSSVSQVEYWLGAEKGANQKSNSGDGEEGGDGAAYLSYNVLMGLTVIGGFFALDHLYLRSPLTFVAKIVINIFFFGVWWLWDALQVIFNRDVIKVFGIGIPSLGPKGIAAGVLANDVPDKKHMAFFIYGLALILGGIFGIDSFIVGDKQTGFIRLVCLLTGIFTPIAVVWWLYNLGVFMFSTKTVTNTYWEYFGAPQPFDQTLTLGQKILIKFPFLQKLFGPAVRVKDAAIRTAKGVVTTAENLVEATLVDPIGTAKRVVIAPAVIAKEKVGEIVHSAEEKIDEAVDKAGEFITGPLTAASDKVKGVVDSALAPITGVITTATQPLITAVEPIKETLDTGIATVKTGLDVAKEGLVLGKSALNTGSAIAGKTLNVVGDTAKAATAALSLAPMAAALPSQLTSSSIAAAKTNLMKGGSIINTGNSNVLPYVLMGTLAIIAVSGLILTYRRSRQNERPRKDDSPPSPEPRVLRESDKKESS